MAVLLIAHELKDILKDYSPFYEAIQKNSSNWWHYLENVWIVKTHLTPDEFWGKLAKHMYKSDRAIIIRVEKDYQGWLPKDAWEWLNNLKE